MQPGGSIESLGVGVGVSCSLSNKGGTTVQDLCDLAPAVTHHVYMIIGGMHNAIDCQHRPLVLGWKLYRVST